MVGMMHVACVYVSHALCCVAGTRAQPQQTSPSETVVLATQYQKCIADCCRKMGCEQQSRGDACGQ